MLKLVITSLILWLLVSCKQDNSSGNVTDSSMNSTIIEQKHTSRIKGPEGFLYVEDGGTGDIPVVFLHSFGGSTEHWNNQREHLETTRRVVAFDFRGNGRSDPAAENRYNPEALADDLAAVADSLKLERFVLVGHSMGGAVAVAYTAAHRERVAGLVLAGAPGKSSP
jgi:pimeloyl-ACP methyl ester carboxylesterase